MWRVPIPHFSPWDCNWPYGPPIAAEAPKQPPPQGDRFVDNPCSVEQSLVDCQNQVLGDSVAITGTPFNLHYRSDWVPGRLAAYTLNISLSGDSIPTVLKRINLEIYVAGQRDTLSFPPASNQSYTFTWNGKDAYDRVLHGRHPVHLRIGYVYQAVYQEPAQFEQSFARFSGIPIEDNEARQEIMLWQELIDTLGTWDARAQGLGGWSLNVHHTYDLASRVLYQGNGRWRSSESIGQIITTVAGNGIEGYSGDGGPATKASLSEIRDVVVGPDGSIYIADTFNNHRIRHVGLDGIIRTIAGNGKAGYSGDGGPAIQAQLNHPWGIAFGLDGSIYIADALNHRIRCVSLDGIITTVAGTGIRGYSGDNGPAIKAKLNHPDGVVVGSDGSLYIADLDNHRIRKVGSDGMITTVAGTGIAGYSGDGGEATEAQLLRPWRVGVGLDGSIYISDGYNYRIRRIGPDGIITTVAGNGNKGFSGDDGLANEAQLADPGGFTLWSDGSLYIADWGNHRIRRVSPDGIITTFIGDGIAGFSGEGESISKARVYYPAQVFAAPDGSLYIADSHNYRIRRVTPSMPGFSVGNITIASDDRSEVYVFNQSGRHLRTLNAHTGAVLYHFSYDSSGFLVQIKDSDGKITQIERDASSNPTAIISPTRQRTTLNVDANGYLSYIKTPAGETTQFGYSEKGLLTNLTDAKGNVYRFVFDELGRLIRGTKTQAVAQLPLQAHTSKLASK